MITFEVLQVMLNLGFICQIFWHGKRLSTLERQLSDRSDTVQP